MICNKLYQTKHGVQCHLPKCTGPPKEPQEGNYACEHCSRRFNSQRGLSQHERHEHPTVRNEAREATAIATKGRPKPKGFGLVWSREEIELMLELEDRLQGMRFIAKEMTKFLPSKNNKQIRDKRSETTYRNQLKEFRAQKQAQTQEGGTPDEDVENSSSTLQERQRLDYDGETREGFNEQLRLPERVVLDYSTSITREEKEWQDNIIQAIGQMKMSNNLGKLTMNTIHSIQHMILEVKNNEGRIPISYLDHIYEIVIEHITRNRNRKIEHKRSKNRPQRRKERQRSYRRYVYAKTRDLFKANPGELARYVRENIIWYEPEQTQLAENDIKDHYNRLWGIRKDIQQPFTAEMEKGGHKTELQDILQMITIKDINERLRRTKGDTATGPDGITKKDLQQKGISEILALLFTLITIGGEQPSSWKVNRTKLILKPGKETGKIKNYRPVTIGSLISRMYWGIIDKRLRMFTQFSPWQKGFVNESGCFNNVRIINEIINIAKKKNGMVAVQLDVSKAFDTVPHAAIGDTLIRKGLPEFLVKLITNSYQNIRTIIKQGETEIPMELQRGVKQGDPLSPFIFKAMLEPLLVQLEQQEGFDIREEHKVSTLAFADDIILTSTNVQQAKNLLITTERYLKQLGMSIAASKCTAFSIIANKDTWYLKDPGLELIDGEKIPSVNAESTIRYLGGSISPWTGLTLRGLEENFGNTLNRVEKLSLKPHQKTELISKYIVPLSL
jgi:hypothetical protein